VSIARMVPWIKGAVTDVNQDTIAKLFWLEEANKIVEGEWFP
jgi:hypothetical protein